jgi:hypothetical protein
MALHQDGAETDGFACPHLRPVRSAEGSNSFSHLPKTRTQRHVTAHEHQFIIIQNNNYIIHKPTRPPAHPRTPTHATEIGTLRNEDRH